VLHATNTEGISTEDCESPDLRSVLHYIMYVSPPDFCLTLFLQDVHPTETERLRHS